MSDVTLQGFPEERSEGRQSSGKKCRRKIRENDKGQGNIEEKRERGIIEEAQEHAWIRKWPSSFFLRNIPHHLHLNVVYNSTLWPLWLVNQFVEINGKCVYRNSCTISLPETWAEFSISSIVKKKKQIHLQVKWPTDQLQACYVLLQAYSFLFLTNSRVSQNHFCGNQTCIICY